MERQTQAKPNGSAVAVVDAVEDEHGRPVTIAPSDQRIYLRGWALDAGARALAAVEFDVGGARAAGPCAELRPDVAVAFGSPDEVGFRIELPLDAASPGHHAVTLEGRRADGSRVRIPVGASLDVVPALRSLPAGASAGAVAGALDDMAVEGAATDGGATGALVIPGEGVVVLRGWAATPAGVPATSVYAQVNSRCVVRGMIGYPRPDVAVHFGSARADYGFSIRIEASEIGRGDHVVRVKAIAGGAIGFVGSEARIAVGPPSAPRVFPNKPRLRGRIDLIGRLDGATAVVEERTHLRLGAGERAVITGWAGDPAAKTLPTRVMLVVDGVAHGPVQRGIERPDVVEATACERLRSSGFSAVVRADALGAGFHRADLVALYDLEPVVFDAFSFEVTE